MKPPDPDDPLARTTGTTAPLNDAFLTVNLTPKEKWLTLILAILTAAGAFMAGLAAILTWASEHRAFFRRW